MRRCQNIGCENSIPDTERPTKVYCTPTCKREAARARSLSDHANVSGGFWDGYALIRRRKRCRIALAPVLALLALLAAGCGGSTKTVTHTTTRTVGTLPAPVQGHPCNPADQVMQCVLPPPPRLFALPAHALYGIDFAWSKPSVATMHALGARFGWSYFSYDPAKNWTRALVDAYHRAGIATVGGWETAAGRATQGFNAGFNDAFTQRHQARAVGKADDRPDLFAIDCDCSGPQVASYFQGAQAGDHAVSGLHVPVVAYGGYFPLLWLYQHHLVGKQNFQTYAWSGGRWLPSSIAPLEQYLNGGAFDNDRALAPDYGQWPYAIAHPAASIFPARKFALPHGIHASELNTTRTWDSHHCRNIVRRPVCKSSRYHLLLLAGRLRAVSSATKHHPATWHRYHRLERFHGLSRRLSAT